MMHPSRQAYVEEAAEVRDPQPRDGSHWSSLPRNRKSFLGAEVSQNGWLLESASSQAIIGQEANTRHSLGDGHGH